MSDESRTPAPADPFGVPADPTPATSPSAEPALDFEKADFGGAPAQVACAFCQTPLTDGYWDVNGQVACERCQTELANHVKPVGMDVRARGLAFGFVAAVLGGIGWGLITRLTGYEIGLVAIAVGWFVGVAVARGTARRGGWVMQVGAVGLAYLAVVSQYAIEVWNALDAEPGLAKAAITFGIAIAAPFLQGLGNFLGILIIGFGLWEAWKQSASLQLTISGPFRLSERKPPAQVTVAG